MLRGSGWVLADGSAHPNSQYAQITGRANVPDLRGIFLRGRDHGRVNADGRGNPAGNLELGAYQADMLVAHAHDVEIAEPTTNQTAELGPTVAPNRMGTEVGVVQSNDTGGQETRPRNVTVNYFIKIN
jgi:hypothetical protein